MNLQSLARVAYSVLPKCKYQVLHADGIGVTVETIRDHVDARGFFVTPAGTPIVVEGILSGVTEQTLSWVPEGLSSDGFMTFSTDTKLDLQGDCGADVREGYIFIDTDGTHYRFMRRRRRGCIYTYLLEYLCAPDCP